MLATSLAIVAASCGRGRWPGDVHLRVACLGDSNTFYAGDGEARSWCEYLAELGAWRGWRTINLGQFGASAVDTASRPGGVSLAATDGVQRAVESDADVAVLSYGTNDAILRLSPTDMVAAIARHRDRLERHGIAVYVATVPPLYPPADTAANATIDAFDDALRAAIPADRLIDFRAHATADDVRIDDVRVKTRDGIHVNDAAQRTRARLAYDAIRR